MNNTYFRCLQTSNDRGVLGRICTLIGEAEANIADLNFLERKPDFFRLLVRAELRDATHLHALMTTLEAERDVAAISRYRDPGQSAYPQNPAEAAP